MFSPLLSGVLYQYNLRDHRPAEAPVAIGNVDLARTRGGSVVTEEKVNCQPGSRRFGRWLGTSGEAGKTEYP